MASCCLLDKLETPQCEIQVLASVRYINFIIQLSCLLIVFLLLQLGAYVVVPPTQASLGISPAENPCLIFKALFQCHLSSNASLKPSVSHSIFQCLFGTLYTVMFQQLVYFTLCFLQVANPCRLWFLFLQHAYYVLRHFSCVQLFLSLRTVVHQAPLSMGFSRQEYWSRLQCPALKDRLDPGMGLSLLHYRLILYH